ncbi:WD40 repeat domain-containing protein [Amycolatopsis rubida]|uniref:WD40 repeat domain-containing protein n=1 Tax=Amycolatopsis rubida TaxID=112413 RepID=A0ABX0C874_9PSEU|nr:WD40 repeat domain-containing protein [Amycolatopsis rubida]MYW97921.1 hypothetical protein [Amycolatopsis rubida]NEC62907.1 WD40 repeat domain-containing protein [Amycolatopsis rubida]
MARSAAIDDLLGVAAPLPTSLAGNTGQITATAASRARHLFAADLDSKAVLWVITDPRRPDTVATLSVPGSAVTAAAFGPEGRTLATGSLTGQIRLWGTAQPRHPRQLSAVSAPDPVAHLALPRWANVECRHNGEIRRGSLPSASGQLWDGPDRVRASSVRLGSDVMAAVFSPSDGVLRRWDVADARSPVLLDRVQPRTAEAWPAAATTPPFGCGR